MDRAQLHPPNAVVVIGAGPAGLTAGYELTARGVPVVILEKDTEVGGLARTVEYKGFRFDIGGHRFFTKVGPVARLWRQMLGNDFLRRPRLSRIYYRGRFFDYPLKPLNALRNLGIVTSLRVLLSCLWIKMFPIRPERSFADWVSNRFGRVLFRIFFETYTEKVWGIPCNKIGAQWAAQRIKGLSLKTTVINMLVPAAMKSDATIKSLIEEFDYPRFGPGMMWDAFRRHIESSGGRLKLNSRITRILHDGTRITDVEVDQGGTTYLQPADHVISTMPVRHLIQRFDPPAPDEVINAASRLKYRDFLTVALIIDQPAVFPDNWIYVHDDRVRVGRVQNYKNWSPDMVPDQRFTCLGLEYFCFAGDGLWSKTDAELVELATRELDVIGLAAPSLVREGTVVRAPKAYPVYDEGYEAALQASRQFLERFSNLQLVGRNGMHKYNNQDHSMLTAMLAVRNLFGEQHCLWDVNADDEYHEEAIITPERAARPASGRLTGQTQPAVPRSL
jgi:protoporphyrinogen oxidase